MTILAAVDFSPVSERVVATLPEFTREGEAVVLVHVGEPDPDFVGFDAGPDTVKTQRAQEQARHLEALEKLAEPLGQAGIEVQLMQPRGPSAQTILALADQVQARLIVLGSHGHGALHDLLLGSVAEQVLRKTTRPVMLVPSERP